MRVRVLFFGEVKEIVGRPEESIELDDGARVEDLFARYGRRFPRLADLRPSLAPSVNLQFAEWSARLSADDEVAFLPPVSGGAIATAGEDRIELVRRAIPVEAVVAALKAPEDGAVAVFEGIVRNHSRGKSVLYLEYEAYEPMALAKMMEIGAALRPRFSVRRFALVHRLGRLDIGETSVLVAVASAHRAAAFDACRFGIDTIKRVVPIWKKEYFVDGSLWADGATPSAEAFSRSQESTS